MVNLRLYTRTNSLYSEQNSVSRTDEEKQFTRLIRRSVPINIIASFWSIG